MKKELEKIGLNLKEVAVYLALLELGQTNIERISKKSKVKRTTVYDVLNSLKEKGLVGKTFPNKKTFYFAEDPRILRDILKERESSLEKIIPELLSITNFLDHKPKIRFYEGDAGLKEIYHETLKYPKTGIDIWYPKNLSGELDSNFFINDYVPKRVKKSIWVRAISPVSKDIEKVVEKENQLRKVVFINVPDYDVEIGLMVYGGNKTAIMSYEEKIGLVIESEKVFKSLKSIFNFMWNVLSR